MRVLVWSIGMGLLTAPCGRTANETPGTAGGASRTDPPPGTLGRARARSDGPLAPSAHTDPQTVGTDWGPPRGFTVLPIPLPGEACPRGGLDQACAVYVDPRQGNDRNHGRSPDRPVATLEAGYERLRDRSADQLLLARGRRFEGAFLKWSKSGHSEERPIVFGAYGTGPRPVLAITRDDGLHLTPGFRSAETLRNVAVTGLRFEITARDPRAPSFTPDRPAGLGIRVVGVETSAPLLAENLLIEDCDIRFFGGAIAISGRNPVRNVQIRRNVIVDTYTTEIGNGIYLSHVEKVLIEGNLIDRTKWQQVPGLWPNALDHSIYAQSDAHDVTVRGNILAHAFDGAMQRGHGKFENNVVYDTTIGNHQGYIFAGTTPVEGGIEFLTRGNLFLQIGGPQGEAGTGVQVGNIKSGEISNNAFVMKRASGAAAVALLGRRDRGNVGILGLRGSNNTSIGQDQPIRRVGDTLLDIRLEPLGTPDPGPPDVLAAYHRSLGKAASADAFLEEAALQSAQNWREAYSAPAVLAWARKGGIAPAVR